MAKHTKRPAARRQVRRPFDRLTNWKMSAPKVSIRKQRERYQVKLALEVLQQLDPSMLNYSPTVLHKIVCDELEKNPGWKKYGLVLPSRMSVSRAAEELRKLLAQKSS
jgi:hypothetical protein